MEGVRKASMMGHISLEARRHTQGRSPMFAGSVGEHFPGSQISSNIRGHTQERGLMFAGSVGEALHRSQFSSHTRGHTLGRSPMFAGGVSESLALSLISIAIGSLQSLTLPKTVITTEVTG